MSNSLQFNSIQFNRVTSSDPNIHIFFVVAGADTERSGTGWDELYYDSMSDLDLSGKKVAVFGLGDSVSYAENYSDAAGELHDVFEKLGCQMYGYVSQEGYLHEDSKAIRGDKFCGLLLDMVNQEELTTERYVCVGNGINRDRA